MKTVVIVSDSHGNRQAIDGLDAIFSESDCIIHLGDTSSDGNYIKKKHPEKTYLLNGNCDLYSKFGEDDCDVFPLGEKEAVLDIEGVKIFACHGHAYSVKRDFLPLAKRAEELGCAIALYGHTHEADERQIGGVTLINPGTLSRYSQNSYAYLVINNGKFTQKIVRI